MRQEASNAAEALDLIDEMLSGLPMPEAKALWDILTALRGPDSDDDEGEELKLRTTAILRANALPKTQRDPDNHGHGYNRMDAVSVRGSLSMVGHGTDLSHFMRHFNMAVEAMKKVESQRAWPSGWTPRRREA